MYVGYCRPSSTRIIPLNLVLRVDGSIQKKMKKNNKSINTHASRISANLGHATKLGHATTTYNIVLLQAGRGFATLRLCTKEDGTTNNNLVLYTMEWYIKKGGERSAGCGLKDKERSM